MKLIIDIDEEVYKRIKDGHPESNDSYKCQDEVLYGKPYEERPQGEWIMDKEHTSNSLLWYKCNKCGVYHSPTNFCPSCGADMRKRGVENG